MDTDPVVSMSVAGGEGRIRHGAGEQPAPVLGAVRTVRGFLTRADGSHDRVDVDLVTVEVGSLSYEEIRPRVDLRNGDRITISTEHRLTS